MGGVQNGSGNSEGVGGGVILVVKKWKLRGGGGTLCEIPSVVGVWIFSGTTQCNPTSAGALFSKTHSIGYFLAMIRCS